MMKETGESLPLIVYFCTGAVTVLPTAIRVAVTDEQLVCLDAEGRIVGAFSTGDVYMCSKRPLPACPRA